MRSADGCEFHLADRVDLGFVDLVKRKDVHVPPPLDGKPLDTAELQLRVVGEKVGHCPVDSVRPCADGGDGRGRHVCVDTPIDFGGMLSLIRCHGPRPGRWQSGASRHHDLTS